MESPYKNLFVVLYVGGLYYFILNAKQIKSRLCPFFRIISRNVYFVHLLFAWYFSQANTMCEKYFQRKEMGVFLLTTVSSFIFSITVYLISKAYKERHMTWLLPRFHLQLVSAAVAPSLFFCKMRTIFIWIKEIMDCLPYWKDKVWKMRLSPKNSLLWFVNIKWIFWGGESCW